MRIKVADTQSVFLSLAFAVTTGILLAVGFLPTTQSMYFSLAPHLPPVSSEIQSKLKEMAFFPLFAAILSYSLPKPLAVSAVKNPFGHLVRISIFPLLVSFLFGRIRGTHFDWNLNAGILSTSWYLFFIPIGEEFLFRGWLYSLSERLWRGALFTATNPLPVSLWVTSIAFSLWHTQNLHSSPVSLVFFQVTYTFLTGFYLGYLRWRSGYIWPGVLAHFTLNAVAGI